MKRIKRKQWFTTQIIALFVLAGSFLLMYATDFCYGKKYYILVRCMTGVLFWIAFLTTGSILIWQEWYIRRLWKKRGKRSGILPECFRFFRNRSAIWIDSLLLIFLAIEAGIHFVARIIVPQVISFGLIAVTVFLIGMHCICNSRWFTAQKNEEE